MWEVVDMAELENGELGWPAATLQFMLTTAYTKPAAGAHSQCMFFFFVGTVHVLRLLTSQRL